MRTGHTLRPVPHPERPHPAKAQEGKRATTPWPRRTGRYPKPIVSDRGKIRSRGVTGVTVRQQKQPARAIRNARAMALPPPTLRARDKAGDLSSTVPSGSRHLGRHESARRRPPRRIGPARSDPPKNQSTGSCRRASSPPTCPRA
ncbi:bS18 family ribosomal protein [Actinomadura kijaniata]|uniref:bS18 family ribosomal protein n=1 Tax=Actinomadura kijaniata TaxID=46161 RepID=UPI000A0700C4